MSWLEVETKVKVDDVNSLRKKVLKIATLKKKETKIDDYFALLKKFRKHAYPKKAFRIRKTKEGYEVNFKKWLEKLWDKEIVVKEEFEFYIKNKENIDGILAFAKNFGFVKWINKKKNSESYIYKKNKKASIEIHKLEHLGHFMEIEYKCQMNELEKAKKTIREILRELEIDKKDIDNTGYTKMLWKKGIRFN